jgi:hypothetical protein
MPFVNPERFKRFELFISRHAVAFASAAASGFSSRGKGAVIYYALDDRFEGTLPALPLEYKTKSEIDEAQGQTRDELIQGLLERYQPPTEALFVAIYRDQTYDITRVSMHRSPQQPPSQPA